MEVNYRHRDKTRSFASPTPQVLEPTNFTTIEHLFIISLKRSFETRLAPILGRIQDKQVNYRHTIIEAVDGREMTDEHNPKALPNNTLACTLSHIKALKNAKAMGLPCVFIIEDDVDFSPNFKQRMDTIFPYLPHNWDGCWLNGSELLRNEPYNRYYLKILSMFGAYGYIIPAHRYDFFINGLEAGREPVDTFYKNVQRGMRCFKVREKLLWHTGMPSVRIPI